MISGFNNDDLLDLADIAFDVGTTLGYVENLDGLGGVLNVSDGVHTANIALFGQYAAEGFELTSDTVAEAHS